MSPTARSLVYCRENQMPAGVVERWVGGGRISVRKDLFGCIDLIVLDGVITIGVQATAASGHSARKKKIQELREAGEDIVDWLASPYRKLEVWSWGKQKLKRGGKAVRWRLRREEIKF